MIDIEHILYICIKIQTNIHIYIYTQRGSDVFYKYNNKYKQINYLINKQINIYVFQTIYNNIIIKVYQCIYISQNISNQIKSAIHNIYQHLIYIFLNVQLYKLIHVFMYINIQNSIKTYTCIQQKITFKTFQIYINQFINIMYKCMSIRVYFSLSQVFILTQKKCDQMFLINRNTCTKLFVQQNFQTWILLIRVMQKTLNQEKLYYNLQTTREFTYNILLHAHAYVYVRVQLFQY
eukprot:TRINITY_DN5387_c0_g2_i1.p2 TRINITY_DN5387_c0_g2~~TRINITY_DN5387_c0_g2_i1.p2  ORF type:complete len:235 (-),score=-30.73 TRINITY_DN5387_c0_g2_i1:415-1119(-)